MGREQATTIADQTLGAFHAEFGIANTFGSLDNGMRYLVADFHDHLRERWTDNFVKLSCGAYCLKSPSKVLGDWLRDKYDDTEYWTLLRKKPEILRLASADGNIQKARWTTSGKAIKGLLMPSGWVPRY